ncbi:penicillin-insensitive murein endopeptidase [Halochromatium glycolicum]|nr:penicillin-insensitive murein endopeptidase [Halochromatium glycolicum]
MQPERDIATRLSILWIGAMALVAAAVSAPSSAAETPWSRIDTVAAGRPEAIGGPSNGCLRGASELPPAGEGFVSIRRHRNRFYGHPHTLEFIQEVARAISQRTGDLIMIGDLAQPRGGRMASSHVSHQNGLDVDIWLTLAESARQAWNETPEARDPPTMVAASQAEIGPHWGPEQRFLIKTAAEHPKVDRILVNPVIKRSLCRSEGEAAWLRRLRPWWGHDAHMHVRLKCPSDSTECQQQAPVPPGSGCGSQLDWWFSEEARSPSGSYSSRPKPQPPATCRQILNAS